MISDLSPLRIRGAVLNVMADPGDSSSPTDNSATLTTTFSTTFDTSHSHPSSGQNPLDVTRYGYFNITKS